MDHQHTPAIGRQDIAERGENRGVGHFGRWQGKSDAIVRGERFDKAVTIS
jgi:hypothetical protein